MNWVDELVRASACAAPFVAALVFVQWMSKRSQKRR